MKRKKLKTLQLLKDIALPDLNPHVTPNKCQDVRVVLGISPLTVTAMRVPKVLWHMLHSS
jgi:hypothetical protein